MLFVSANKNSKRLDKVLARLPQVDDVLYPNSAEKLSLAGLRYETPSFQRYSFTKESRGKRVFSRQYVFIQPITRSSFTKDVLYNNVWVNKPSIPTLSSTGI